jgi:hypothetical protein
VAELRECVLPLRDIDVLGGCAAGLLCMHVGTLFPIVVLHGQQPFALSIAAGC